MRKNKNLSEELNVEKCTESECAALNIDTKSVKKKVGQKLAFASSERKYITVKSKKNIVFIAVAAALVLCVTALAAGANVVNWFSTASSVPDYKTLPTARDVLNDVGFDAVLIDEFENGYTFKDGRTVENSLADENGTSLETFKSLLFRYEKGKDTVNFSQEKSTGEVNYAGNVMLNVNGVDVYFFEYNNKLVPSGYKMTDEDKAAQQNGELVFSYGSTKVETKRIQSVTWTKDGKNYELMQIDGRLNADELCNMAREIIEK